MRSIPFANRGDNTSNPSKLSQSQSSTLIYNAWALEETHLGTAFRHDGIAAPCVLDGPINGQSFLAYLFMMLVPALRPGAIVVLDNLGSHKGSDVRAAIQAARTRLVFLLPYSPDLNLIEQALSKLKTFLRKQDPRTAEATWQSVGTVLHRFTPAEC